MSVKKQKPGSIMDIATTDVVTLPPTSTIMAAAKTMKTYRFRRLPIADPGTRRIEGIITATDLVNFFGGGNKYGIVKERYNNNLIAAVNEDVREIMEREIIYLEFTESIEDGLELLLQKGVGGCPILDKEDRIIGIVTERDYLKYMADKCKLQGVVSEYMTSKVITAKPSTTIFEAMKIMISKKIRRLPVIDDGLLIGWLNTPMIVRFFSGEAFKKLITGDAKDVLEQPVTTILSSKSAEYIMPLTISPNTMMADVAKRMLSRRVGCAFIVSENKLEGIVTEQDMVRFLYKCKFG